MTCLDWGDQTGGINQLFAGVKIGHVGMDQSFVKWNNRSAKPFLNLFYFSVTYSLSLSSLFVRMKKLFHNDYVQQGGEQDFKVVFG